MNHAATQPPVALAKPASPVVVREPSLTPGDMAELLATFNDVTVKLQASHEHLTAEVARLSEELKHANEAVARSQRLAALGEMAAGIAHEVRNPLGSIRLYARMLEQDLAQQPPQALLAGKITGAARVVEGIVHDVLAFAKEFKVRHDPVDACEAMTRAWESVCDASVLANAGEIGSAIDVRCDWDESRDIALMADSALLHQALVNVIQNAVQAMVGDVASPNAHARHRLTLGVAEAQAFDRSHRTYGTHETHETYDGTGPSRVRGSREAVVVLAVKDSGPGVSQDTIERMFNPFFTTRAQGTGLGLAIVHRIIDAHGGYIRVRNNRDLVSPTASEIEQRGACVEIVLPAKARQDVSASEKANRRVPSVQPRAPQKQASV